MPFICKCQKIYKVNDKTFKIKLILTNLLRTVKETKSAKTIYN